MLEVPSNRSVADKFLLVPGTGGVDFKREDGTPAPYGKELAWGHVVGQDAELIAELSCEHPVNDTASGGDFSPTKTSLSPGRSLSPFQTLLGTAYNKLPLSYGSFAYDWRLDIRHNGKLLLEFLRGHRQGRNAGG